MTLSLVCWTCQFKVGLGSLGGGGLGAARRSVKSFEVAANTRNRQPHRLDTIRIFTTTGRLCNDRTARESAHGQGVTTSHEYKSQQSRPARSDKAAQSLRRVAAEAQQSRVTFVRGHGRRRFLDPGADTRHITASCSAEQYDIRKARELLRQAGYDDDPLRTGLFPQVVHIQTAAYSTEDHSVDRNADIGLGDIFVFPSGSVVSWNVPETLQKHLIRQVLLPAAVNPHLATVEIEDMDYIEDSSRATSQVIGDAIVLGTQRFMPEAYRHGIEAASTASPNTDTDVVLAKIAFSSGIARSTKLAVLENLLSSYFETTRTIPTILSRGSKLRFSRSFILRKTGELLSIRAQLNLYSELTDTMPDIFWDSPSQLGLSDYYDEVGRALDVNARIRTLNQKMDYASEIASVLRERLSEKHSTGLEWLIIFLISVEVAFELLRLWREHRAEARENNNRTAADEKNTLLTL